MRTVLRHAPDFTKRIQLHISQRVAILLLCAALFSIAYLPAEPVNVRQPEGQLHGFLVLRSQDGVIIANGDLIQSVRGGQLTNRLVFHFKDGSVQDETALISQNSRFRLITDHLIQKGPTFKHPVDMSINVAAGMVAVQYQGENGKDKTETAHLTLPADLCNGMVPTLLKNTPDGAPPNTVSMVVATPKPLLVKLAITPEGQESFVTGGVTRQAIRYDVKIEIGGIKGVLAPLVGKQPPDTRVWMLGGAAPAFLRAEGPSCLGCPIWRTELVSPTWPEGGADTADRKK